MTGLCRRAARRAQHPGRGLRAFPGAEIHAGRRGGDLSGGQQQQLAIGRALVTRRACSSSTSRPKASSPRSSRTSGGRSACCANAATWPSCWSSSISTSPATLADQFVVLERGEIVAHGARRRDGDEDVKRSGHLNGACAARAISVAGCAGRAVGVARSSAVASGDGTRLTTMPTRTRLRVQKPLFPKAIGVCHAISSTPPGGIAGGDQLRRRDRTRRRCARAASRRRPRKVLSRRRAACRAGREA